MRKYQIVIDTNVFVTALRSQLGASYRLLMLIGSDKFETNISVPLVLEYEDAARRLIPGIVQSENDLAILLDYICTVSNRKEIFYLWRPFLKDPKDDMVLELAVSAECELIVTYNKRDFKGVEQFGIELLTAKEFLERIGEVP